MAIRRILIANRGEIAARIIRTCRKLDIETVLAVSEADRDSLPATLADRTVCIGPARSSDSYLKADTIVQAALGTKADAIHPGYGFLSERPVLAQLCEAHGVVFIGPTAAQIEAVADKLRARAEAVSAGVPVAPGATVTSVAEAMAAGREIGTPLLVKAASGGGGRGMKRVDRLEDLPAAMELASAEAQAAFGDARVFLERYIGRARHVEVQVLGDGRGGSTTWASATARCSGVIKSCSRNHPQAAYRRIATPSARGGGALRRSPVLSRRGHGGVSRRQQQDSFYFLEMNARIQVEHPVTEAVTGFDLIAEQISIASGAGLSFAQSDVHIEGCAIECRVNAEDPDNNFAPSPGIAREAIWPGGEGIRVDTHIVPGSRIPPFYDSLLGKVIAHGTDRKSALERLRAAIAAVRIVGVKTNLSFHAMLLADPEFQAGGVDTGFVERLLARGQSTPRCAHG